MRGRIRELAGLALALAILAVLALQWRVLHHRTEDASTQSPPAADNSKTAQSSADLRPLLDALRGADKIVLWEGLPHPVNEEEVFDEERRSKKNFELHGHHFYSEPLTLAAPDAGRLTALLRDEKSLQPWRGDKLCGEFHPDYALEYHVGARPYRLLLCLGCQELRIFSETASAFADLRDEPFKTLKQVLSPYRKSRPENTAQLIGQAVGDLASRAEARGALADRKPSRRPVIGKVTAGTPKIIGAFEQAMIEHAIRNHLDPVKRCYEDELQASPSLAGRVVIQITVTASGQVAASIVQSSTLNNSSVEQCIAIEVRTWKFPRPSGGGIAVISSPFTLKPETKSDPG